MKGKSAGDISYEKHAELYVMLSEPLKAMQVEYFDKVSSQCYKEKHMADDVPNPEQVNVCKDRIHSKMFGGFFQRLANVRDSNRFRYTDCLFEAGNDIEMAGNCIAHHLKAYDRDNKDLVEYFKSQPELSKYL